ncbi:MAG TPA: AIR synthase-related protein, partial [Acidimicrobiales bacterium]|nr:AIR synthase-related protein [Acidimicrobiales bacterium]
LLLLGSTVASLAGSRWAAERAGNGASVGGGLPPLDLALHRLLVDVVVELVTGGAVSGVHDVSDGGLGVALAEMAVHSATGLVVGGIADHAELFSESPSRVIVCAPDPDAIVGRARSAGLAVSELGIAGGDRLVVEGLVDLALADLEHAWRSTLPDRLADAR